MPFFHVHVFHVQASSQQADVYELGAINGLLIVVNIGVVIVLVLSLFLNVWKHRTALVGETDPNLNTAGDEATVCYTCVHSGAAS